MTLIDYDDMQLFKGASVPERTEDDKYAVILQYPKRKVGKFCISTEKDVCHSITALSELTIPQEIEDPARYYIKQAALHYNIDASWESKECSRIVDMNEVELHKTAETVEYNINIGESIFSLDSSTAVKLAEEYFLDNIGIMTIDDRSKIASVICKEGALFPDFLPLQQTVGYAHPTTSNHNKEFNFRRKVASDNSKYIEALEKVAEAVNIIPPILFLDRVRTIDKAASINPEQHGHPYSRFFTREFDHDNDIDIEKLAFLTNIASDETAVEKLSKIL